MAVSPPITFTERAEQLRGEIDQALATHLQFSDNCPAPLIEAVRYAALGPGKRLRPMLVLLASEACGGSVARALPAAVAIEMVHAYSLRHDDLPAMDDDDLRRGRPTCHRAFDEATAILAGDALLSRAFELIATQLGPADVAVTCLSTLAQAAGAEGMVGGQMQDLLATATAKELENAQCEQRLESMHRCKTGALFVAALRMGGLVASASAEELAALTAYGENVGLAFQIVDDLLDVGGSEDQMGKRVQKDDSQGKLTFPGVVGVAESKARVAALIQQGCDALGPLGSRADCLRELAAYLGERNS